MYNIPPPCIIYPPPPPPPPPPCIIPRPPHSLHVGMSLSWNAVLNTHNLVSIFMTVCDCVLLLCPFLGHTTSKPDNACFHTYIKSHRYLLIYSSDTETTGIQVMNISCLSDYKGSFPTIGTISKYGHTCTHAHNTR